VGEFFDAQAFTGAGDEGEALAEVVEADVEALGRRFRGLHPPAAVLFPAVMVTGGLKTLRGTRRREFLSANPRRSFHF